MNYCCYDHITEIINATKPDLILLTGDVVYGEFDDNGSSLTDFVAFMETFKIPWAPVFGNHDAETVLGVDWQCEQFEKAEYCLFKQRELTGNGNYTVGIKQDGKLRRVFFMLDSNGCTWMSQKSKENGHYRTAAGFGQDQIDWYTNTINEIKKNSPDTKYSFAFHIQLQAFADALAKYGFTNQDTINNPINIDRVTPTSSQDFGYVGRDLKNPWDTDYTVWCRWLNVCAR